MSKTVTEFTGKRIVIDTPLPIDDIVARLDVELSKDRAGPKLVQFLKEVKTKAELEQGLRDISGGKDFVFFNTMTYQNWRNAYNGTSDTPKLFQYTFGNPLFAETMATHDHFAALNVPLRLLVAEKTDRSGSHIVYLQPSSIIAVPVNGVVNHALKAAAEALDKKVERLLETVTN